MPWGTACWGFLGQKSGTQLVQLAKLHERQGSIYYLYLFPLPPTQSISGRGKVRTGLALAEGKTVSSCNNAMYKIKAHNKIKVDRSR